MPMQFPNTTDPYDLEVVYPRDANTAASSLLDIDIVAIHGLNIEGNFLHYKDTWTINRKLWLRDVLPGAFSKRCRIMLFSYNIGAHITENDTKLSRHADRLLGLLRMKRLGVTKRPLLFICHDIGGLIVKDALVSAGMDEMYKPILDATRLLVFFNTPHRNAGSVARTIAQAAVRTPSPAVVEKLEKECDELMRRVSQSELTRRLYDKRLVLNLFATNPHLGKKLLVTRQSTILNLPDYWEKHLPIYGDHTSMCKFESGKDAGCQMVIKTMAMEVARALAMHSTAK